MSAETLLSVGIDLGTTTTQLVFSRLTVRNEGSAFSVPNYTVAAREVLRRSAVHFTPLRSERELDAEAIARIVDAEYAAAGIDRRAVQTGAVIITGETARRENARAVLEALSGYAGDFVVATAGPALESALAGRGAGAADYAQAHACTVVNLDIGGGTTNIARFTNGALTDTACLNVGGRLVKLEPDGRVTYVSPVLRPFVPYAPGDRLTPQDLAPTVALLTEILEEALGFRPVQDEARLPETAANRAPESDAYRQLLTENTVSIRELVPPDAVISFSGGVADLIEHSPAEPLRYGDLGVLLGRAVAKSAVGPRIPARETIRATVIGAGCHATELSGSTVYFDRIAFPLKNLPVAALTPEEERLPPAQLAQTVRARLAVFEGGPAVLALQGQRDLHFAALSALADGLAGGLRGRGGPVLVAVAADVGKALGQALAVRLPGVPLLCLDGVQLPPGSYLDVAAPIASGQVLPVVIKTLVF